MRMAPDQPDEGIFVGEDADDLGTSLAVLDVTPDGFKLVELAPGNSFDEVQVATGARNIA